MDVDLACLQLLVACAVGGDSVSGRRCGDATALGRFGLGLRALGLTRDCSAVSPASGIDRSVRA